MTNGNYENLNINCATEGNPAAHLKNALEYIQNPDKTEQCHLMGSVNCLPDTAYEQMLDTKNLYGKSGKRQGYHVIISFPPEEAVTPGTGKNCCGWFYRRHTKW